MPPHRSEPVADPSDLLRGRLDDDVDALGHPGLAVSGAGPRTRHHVRHLGSVEQRHHRRQRRRGPRLRPQRGRARACRARCRPRAGSGTSAARWRVRSPSGRPRAFQRTPHDSISPIWQTATNSSCRNAERQARRPAVARVLDAGWFTKPALPMTASVAHPAHRHPSEVDRSRCSAIPNCGTSCDGLARQRRSGGRGCWSVARPDHRSRT